MRNKLDDFLREEGIRGDLRVPRMDELFHNNSHQSIELEINLIHAS